MRISEAGIAAIKTREGRRLNAYPDPASGGDPWTIGYGHTAGVQPGQHITAEQADEFLRADLAECESAISRLVTVPITQAQFDALCSFVFNVGAGAFAGSTLLRKLNAGDVAGAADEFLRWDNAAGKKMPGLITRRAAERAMFLGGGEAPAAPTEAPSAPSVADVGHSEQPRTSMPLPLIPILSAVLPSLIDAIPKLGKLFGSGSQVSDRNIAAATTVAQIVQQATGAVNVQEAAERIASDPVARAAATQAVETRWFELAEAGGGGIEGARKADAATVQAGTRPWLSPSMWALLVLLPLVYMVVGSVAGIWGTAQWSADVRAAIATAVISLVVGGASGYYWGATTSRNRPTQP